MSGRVEQLAEGVTTIYALCESDGRVRYVGKTIGTPERRLVYHIHHARKGGTLPSARWIRKRVEAGFRPIIKVLELVGANWAERECFWISFYRAVEPDLLNITDGGEGTLGRVPSMEHRRKIAEALRTGAHFNCEVCGTKFWRKQRDIKRGDSRFCSKGCYQVWQRGVPKPIPASVHTAGIIAAAEAKRAATHCRRGHEYSDANTYLNSWGARVCKECQRLHKAKYRERLHGLA